MLSCTSCPLCIVRISVTDRKYGIARQNKVHQMNCPAEVAQHSYLDVTIRSRELAAADYICIPPPLCNSMNQLSPTVKTRVICHLNCLQSQTHMHVIALACFAHLSKALPSQWQAIVTQFFHKHITFFIRGPFLIPLPAMSTS